MRHIGPLISLAALAALAAPLAAQTPTPPPPPQIVTNGEGEAQVIPDRARVSLAVETRGQTAAAAATENARVQTAVLTRLRALGIPSERLLTIGYSVQPEYNRSREPNAEPRVIGYVARNTIRADVHQMDQVGRVIDAALAAGANSLGRLDMYSSREDAARREALANAVQAARRDAEAMAAAAGGGLGPLIEITSGGFFRPPQPYDMMARGAEMALQAADTPISAGEQTIRANVMARWQFVPGGTGR
jgi:hypothetical protein